ncbi:MAG: hypothetical protein CVV27_00575 [Candidatus Melainabacteria bacterium HGW-Melainabacteria-1]|nr:MAG: hypothetical protein CVV27_00575 [Candidatus Melainabacteria bacterium HGW-Melainabacteria-1]
MPRFTPRTIFLALWLIVFAGFALRMPAWAEEPDEGIRLRLLHTGQVGGLASAYRYDIRQPYVLASSFLQMQGAALGLKDFAITGNTIPFYARDNYLWGPGFGIHQLRSFLRETPEPLARQPVLLLQSQDSLIGDISESQQLMQHIESWLPRQQSLREGFRLRQAELIRYPGPVYQLRLQRADAALPADPLRWELLIGFELSFRGPNQQAQDPSQLIVIGQPQGEGSRRLRLLEQLRGPEDLLVDSGNLLEGLSSIATNRLSLQRENSLKMASSLNYTAINVGKNELLGGLEQLYAEQDQYRLPLISASLKRDGAYVFAPYQIIHAGQFRLALIGLGDHTEFEHLRAMGILPADTEILAPAEALSQALTALREQEQVELVALLTPLDSQGLQQLAPYTQLFHLVLANPDAPLQQVRESILRDIRQPGRPFVVNSHPLAISLLELEAVGERVQISAEQLPVSFETSPDPRFLPEIMRIRQQAYEDALDPLLPDPAPLIRQDPELLALFYNSAASREAARRLGGLQPLNPAELLDLYPPYLTAELLANLEMNGLMEAFEAEAMVMRLGPGMELAMPGALPRLLAYERLKTPDLLERYYLNGDQLKKLLALKLPGLAYGGLSPEQGKVRGREIGDKRSVYRVLIPSGTASLAGLRPLLTNIRRESLLQSPFAPSDPSRVYLRDAVIGLLERLGHHPDYARELTRLLKPSWAERRLLFSLQLDQLQLNLSGYNAINHRDYAEVRETRVTSPSSFSFGGRSRLGLGLDNQWLGFSLGGSGKYEALSLIDESTATAKERYSENQDDLIFFGELQLRLLEFSLFANRLQLTPYLEGIYDSEFTPTLNPETQAFNPLQSELRGVLGLAIPPSGPLKTFKTGLALRRDFNVPGNLEAGLDLKLLHEQPLSNFVSWNNDLSVRYFFTSPNDDASSLGLIGQWVSSFQLSLTENLSLRLYADSYLFQGKLPGSQLGASVILGIGMGYDRIWKPWFEPLW